jgi:hypothetical protein
LERKAAFRGLSPELATVRDLFAKLEYDFERMRSRPDDIYAAFDFVVTAEHMCDWNGEPSLNQRIPLLRIVSHLASGAKYFEATRPRHNSVRDVTHRSGLFDSAIFDGNIFDVGRVSVKLDGAHAAEFGTEVSLVDLGAQVVTFWRHRLGQASRGDGV